MFRKPYGKKNNPGQSNFTESLYIPDQTMSIPELIRRYASGQSLGAGIRTGFYDDDENELLQGKPLAYYDLVDQKNIIEHAKSEYDETMSRIKSRNKKNQPVGETPGKGVESDGNQAT